MMIKNIGRPSVTGLGSPAACPGSSGFGPFILAGPAADGGVRSGGGGSPAQNCSAAVVMTDDSAAAVPLLTRWNKPGKPVKTPLWEE